MLSPSARHARLWHVVALVALTFGCAPRGGSDAGRPAAAVTAERKPAKDVEWKEVRRPLKVDCVAYLASVTSEGHVRLIRTEELHRKFLEAQAEKNERKWIDIALDPSRPIVSIDNGIRVKVLSLGEQSAKVEMLDGASATEVAFCRPTELDPGVDRIPIEIEHELPKLIEAVNTDHAEPKQTEPATADHDHLPNVVDHTRPPGSGTVHVNGYYRKNGTYVQPHTRSAPGSRRR